MTTGDPRINFYIRNRISQISFVNGNFAQFLQPDPLRVGLIVGGPANNNIAIWPRQPISNNNRGFVSFQGNAQQPITITWFLYGTLPTLEWWGRSFTADATCEIIEQLLPYKIMQQLQ